MSHTFTKTRYQWLVVVATLYSACKWHNRGSMRIHDPKWCPPVKLQIITLAILFNLLPGQCNLIHVLKKFFNQDQLNNMVCLLQIKKYFWIGSVLLIRSTSATGCSGHLHATYTMGDLCSKLSFHTSIQSLLNAGNTNG